MAAQRRLQKEYTEISKNVDIQKIIKKIEFEDQNMLIWSGLILPDTVPYNKGAFKVQIEFPIEYPFKPPKITFKTKIYHPNVDEKGQVCLPIINPEQWKPATKAEDVIYALFALINEPQVDHPLRADVAEEYKKDINKFKKTAEEFTKKFAEKREG